MDTDDNKRRFFYALLCVSLFGLGYGLGRTTWQGYERAAAVEAGVARYAVNPATGETRFEYVRGVTP